MTGEWEVNERDLRWSLLMCFCGVDVHDGGNLLIARISESSRELVILVRSLCILVVMCINVKVETEHVRWSVLRADTAVHDAAGNSLLVLF